MRAAGIGWWYSTGLTYFSTRARLPGVPSCLKRKSTLAACEARISSLVGEVPELALERADRLLAAGVDELDVRLAFLALVLAVGEDPLLDRLVELGREGRVLEQGVLEAGGEVDLGAAGGRELVEHVVRQRAGAVLDRTREAVLASDRGELGQDVEVEGDLGDAAARRAECRRGWCRSGRRPSRGRWRPWRGRRARGGSRRGRP